MLIGIDGSRAFLENRTGIEEYSYQVIKHLRGKLKNHQVILYLRKEQIVDFELPENWKVKNINFRKLWTQIGLSWELFTHPVDVLFVPAHTVPLVHPQKNIVVVHGLEYEFCPEAYSTWDRFYMRLSIKKSCQWASRIISVSQNTKKDLINLYNVTKDKIIVIGEGYEEKFQNPKVKFQTNSKIQRSNFKPFILFVGRIEERKNIVKIIEAFEILKEKHDLPHKLVLAGRPGHGYENIKLKISDSEFKDEIVELGFVSEEDKWELLKNADVFVFPTKYEGFGIPILEAQSVGTPVVAANNSSIPEVAGEGAILVDPENSEAIANAVHQIISSEEIKKDLIEKGFENVKRFSWEKCAREIADILTK